jgi:hypothetical protein
MITTGIVASKLWIDNEGRARKFSVLITYAIVLGSGLRPCQWPYHRNYGRYGGPDRNTRNYGHLILRPLEWGTCILVLVLVLACSSCFSSNTSTSLSY